MFGSVLVVEMVLGVALVLVVVFVALTTLRRRLIASDTALSLCAVRVVPSPRWRTGMLQLTSTALEWYPILGLTARAGHRWPRVALEVSSAEAPGEDVPLSLVGVGSIRRVRFFSRADGDAAHIEVLLDVDVYTSLRAWIEAAPPTDWRTEN